jgi:phosphoglycolate phosphatase
MSSKKVKAIIHDWDDTIVKSFETYSGWYPLFGEYYGLENVPMEDIKASWGNTLTKIVSLLWPDIPKNDIERMLVEFADSDIFKNGNFVPPLFPGVKRAIVTLNKNGYMLGVLSSGRENSIKGSYKKFLDKDLSYHHFIHTQENQSHHKPDPRVFDKAFEITDELGIKSSEIIYVGDSVLDYKAADSAGIVFIGTVTGLNTKEELIDHGLKQELILDSFADLPGFLENFSIK